MDYETPEKVHTPRTGVLVCDATFYGKRKDKLGTLVFKDITETEALIWKHKDKRNSSRLQTTPSSTFRLGVHNSCYHYRWQERLIQSF